MRHSAAGRNTHCYRPGHQSGAPRPAGKQPGATGTATTSGRPQGGSGANRPAQNNTFRNLARHRPGLRRPEAPERPANRPGVRPAQNGGSARPAQTAGPARASTGDAQNKHTKLRGKTWLSIGRITGKRPWREGKNSGRTQEQSQRKLLSKVVSLSTHGKRKRKPPVHHQQQQQHMPASSHFQKRLLLKKRLRYRTWPTGCRLTPAQ